MKQRKPLIYLSRKFDEFLSHWKTREDRLPLIIKGARQVGKTECVRRFAETHYENVVEINFAERPEFKSIVRDGYSVENVVRNISVVDPTMKFISGSTIGGVLSGLSMRVSSTCANEWISPSSRLVGIYSLIFINFTCRTQDC